MNYGNLAPVKKKKSNLKTITHNNNKKKWISLPVTVYNKNLTSQCYLTTQKEPVQDKYTISIDFP
jgi:Leucine-rich repeat (LRR) protein